MNGKVLNVLTKTVGVAGLGLVLYDSHNAGKIYAPITEMEGKSSSLSHHYLEDMKLESSSKVRAAAKEGIFKYNLDENLTGFYHSTLGYIHGFTSMLITNAIPFALSIGTLIGGKGIFSKACGVGLLGYGAIFLAQEAFGVGKKEK